MALKCFYTMQTIFDYAPTPDELDAIGFNSFIIRGACNFVGDDMTKDDYIDRVPNDRAIFDIAILHELRGLDPSEFWAQIPELHAEYMRGFDCVAEPVN